MTSVAQPKLCVCVYLLFKMGTVQHIGGPKKTVAIKTLEGYLFQKTFLTSTPFDILKFLAYSYVPALIECGFLGVRKPVRWGE